jgi:hypothetical protein
MLFSSTTFVLEYLLINEHFSLIFGATSFAFEFEFEFSGANLSCFA